MRMPIATTAVIQMTAMAIVMRLRLRSAMEEPPRLLDIPPPNMSDRPPPRPLCIKIRKIKKKPDNTSKTFNRTSVHSTSRSHSLMSGSGAGCSADCSAEDKGNPSELAGRATVVLEIAADGCEVIDLDRCATHEGSVHISLRHQVDDTVGLDRTAINDAN